MLSQKLVAIIIDRKPQFSDFSAAMSKQLVTLVLLWIFVLFRTPVPAVGDLNSGTRCTVQDSPRKRNLHLSFVRVCCECLHFRNCETKPASS